MTYTYDSCKRFPIEYLQNSICDEICSFDLDDVTKYSFKIIPNSIYIEKQSIKESFDQDVYFIMIVDERLQTLNKNAAFPCTINRAYNFQQVGKHKSKDLYPGIT